MTKYVLGPVPSYIILSYIIMIMEETYIKLLKILEEIGNYDTTV